MSGRQRFRFIGEEQHGGRRVAVIRDRDRDEEARVYFSRGYWRRWEVGYGDRPAGGALAAVARQGLATQERIGEAPAVPEELEAAPAKQAETVRLFEAPKTTPGQLTMGGGE